MRYRPPDQSTSSKTWRAETATVCRTGDVSTVSVCPLLLHSSRHPGSSLVFRPAFMFPWAADGGGQRLAFHAVDGRSIAPMVPAWSLRVRRVATVWVDGSQYAVLLVNRRCGARTDRAHRCRSLAPCVRCIDDGLVPIDTRPIRLSAHFEAPGTPLYEPLVPAILSVLGA